MALCAPLGISLHEGVGHKPSASSFLIMGGLLPVFLQEWAISCLCAYVLMETKSIFHKVPYISFLRQGFSLEFGTYPIG